MTKALVVIPDVSIYETFFNIVPEFSDTGETILRGLKTNVRVRGLVIIAHAELQQVADHAQQLADTAHLDSGGTANLATNQADQLVDEAKQALHSSQDIMDAQGDQSTSDYILQDILEGFAERQAAAAIITRNAHKVHAIYHAPTVLGLLSKFNGDTVEDAIAITPDSGGMLESEVRALINRLENGLEKRDFNR